MNIFKRILVLTFLLFLFCILCAKNYSNAITKNISDSVFRLHILANSNSIDDQNLKYEVRDNILEFLSSISNNENSKAETKNIIVSNLDTIKRIAQNTIIKRGYNYPVCVEIGNFSFPAKTYGDISFPPGYYDALRIKIGKATGQNWWCVMFPPLCFVDVSSGIVPNESKQILESQLTEEEYSLISENRSETNLKFKIVELLQNLKFNGIFM